MSFIIALSAISCAVASGALALGIISPILTGAGYFVGIIALMVPLSKKFYLGGFLAYVGTCILAVVLGAAVKFWDLVPFVMFFGLHPLANALQQKFKINKIIALIVKALWFDATLIAGYYLVFGGFIVGAFLPENISVFINKYILVFIFTLGTLVFAVYDHLIIRCQALVDALVYRIKK